jgi:hypothetical protein
MTIAALAPTLAGALGSVSPVFWVELCSAHGVKRIAVDVTGNPIDSNSPTQQQTEHCPWCHIEHVAISPPLAAPPMVYREAQSDDFLPNSDAPRSASYRWPPTHSRGPPAPS